MKKLWRKVVCAVKTLFGGKCLKPIEMKWYGKGTTPNGGSYNLSSLSGGTATTSPVEPQKISVDCVLDKMTVKLSTPVKGYMSILLYRYINGVWITGWCPSIEIKPGVLETTIDLPELKMTPDMGLLAWLGYPPALGNEGPIDVEVTVVLNPL